MRCLKVKMPPSLNFIMFWLDKFGNDYHVLKFILTRNENENEKQTWAVLNVLTAAASPCSLNFEKPGTDYDIYSSIIGRKPQPIPELKKYSEQIQKKYNTHYCWVRWAGIFDRSLTAEQRQILIHYRTAFLCLLVNGFTDQADMILQMAENPCTASLTDRITGEFLYSKEVLRFILGGEIDN
jgi:hypothetical protein